MPARSEPFEKAMRLLLILLFALGVIALGVTMAESAENRSDPEVKEIINRLLGPLTYDDLEGHVASLSDDVIWQISEEPVEEGKESYRKRLSHLLKTGERLKGFAIRAIGFYPPNTWVAVVEEQREARLELTNDNPRVITIATFSRYRVKENKVVGMEIAAVLGMHQSTSTLRRWRSLP